MVASKAGLPNLFGGDALVQALAGFIEVQSSNPIGRVCLFDSWSDQVAGSARAVLPWCNPIGKDCNFISMVAYLLSRPKRPAWCGWSGGRAVVIANTIGRDRVTRKTFGVDLSPRSPVYSIPVSTYDE